MDNIGLGSSQYDDGVNSLKKTMFPTPMDGSGVGGGRGRNGQAALALDLHEMENKGILEIRSKMADIVSEMESQRLKLDRILSLMEDEEDQTFNTDD